MTSAVYGTATPNAQAVIDTAITVWMQMGLTEDQILYGIAMMNVESGYNPVVTNNVPIDSIRGLGQFNTATWNATAKSFDAQYGLQFTPILSVSNSAYNVNSPEGTNAQAGESNDPGAGVYDPDGLVSQLEVVGQGIIKEWQQANSLTDQFSAEVLYADGVTGASLLVQDSPTNSGPDAALLSTVALAYLNHHEGYGWWNINAKIPRPNNISHTIYDLNTPKTGLASALQRAWWECRVS